VAFGTSGFVDVSAYRSRAAADSSVNAAQKAKPSMQASSYLFYAFTPREIDVTIKKYNDFDIIVFI